MLEQTSDNTPNLETKREIEQQTINRQTTTTATCSANTKTQHDNYSNLEVA